MSPVTKRRDDNVPLQALLTNLTVDRVDFVGAGANGESDIALFKSRQPAAMPRPTRKGATVPDIIEPTPEQIAELQKSQDDAVAAALAKYAADLAELAKDEAVDDPAPEMTETDKAVAKAIAVRDAAAQVEKAALEARIAKMEDERATEVFKAQAASFNLVGSIDDIADVLKAVNAKCDEATFKKATTLFAAAQERIKTGDLTKDAPGRQVIAEDSPYGVLKAAADELVEKTPGLRPDEAFAKAIAANPAVYAEYRKTLPAGNAA